VKIKKPGSGSSSSMGAGKSSSGSKSVSMKSIEPGEGIIHTSFLDQLTNVQIDDIKKSLKELIEEIDEVGSKLAFASSMDIFFKYKNLIRQFIKEVEGSLYKITENPSIRFLDNNKVFVIVNKIDKSLEEFTKDIMSNQIDRLEIVRRVDEIRGMLMDVII